MDPEWEHAHLCLKLRNFYPITYKIDHTNHTPPLASSAAAAPAVLCDGQR